MATKAKRRNPQGIAKEGHHPADGYNSLKLYNKETGKLVYETKYQHASGQSKHNAKGRVRKFALQNGYKIF